MMTTVMVKTVHGAAAGVAATKQKLHWGAFKALWASGALAPNAAELKLNHCCCCGVIRSVKKYKGCRGLVNLVLALLLGNLQNLSRLAKNVCVLYNGQRRDGDVWE